MAQDKTDKKPAAPKKKDKPTPPNVLTDIRAGQLQLRRALAYDSY